MSTENQPEPSTVFDRRNCSNCGFSKKIRQSPTDIKKVRICAWGPPQMVPTFTPQGMTIQIMQPPVNEHMLCNQHRFLTEIANANSSPREGQPS